MGSTRCLGGVHLGLISPEKSFPGLWLGKDLGWFDAGSVKLAGNRLRDSKLWNKNYNYNRSSITIALNQVVKLHGICRASLETLNERVTIPNVFGVATGETDDRRICKVFYLITKSPNNLFPLLNAFIKLRNRLHLSSMVIIIIL